MVVLGKIIIGSDKNKIITISKQEEVGGWKEGELVVIKKYRISPPSTGICLHCGEKLEIRKDCINLNPKRRFCDSVCSTRYNAKRRYYKNKDNLKDKEKRRKYQKEWYKKNKEKQNRNVLRNYKKNKRKWGERKYVQCNREKILNILPKECYLCGNKNPEIVHHETYKFQPRYLNRTKEERQEYLINYCKKLKVFCSIKCHIEYHQTLKLL